MRPRVARSVLALSILGAVCLDGCAAMADSIVTFDDLSLAPNSFWNGPDPNGTIVNGPFGPETHRRFTSGGVAFANNFQNSFGSWDGFAYSNTSDTTTPGFTNQ